MRTLRLICYSFRAMRHYAISFELAGDILADVEISEMRSEEHFDAIGGLHPDLGKVMVIRTRVDAFLFCEKDLKDPRTLAKPRT
jgi:hypothetical protein